MGATLEPITAPAVYLLREGTKHNRFGDPYQLAALVEVRGTVAEIKGATGRLKDIPAIREVMRAIGVTEVRWERIVGGERIPHTLKIDRTPA